MKAQYKQIIKRSFEEPELIYIKQLTIVESTEIHAQILKTKFSSLRTSDESLEPSII